ncbi:uncharacterized protein LOC122377189, partial [Amphibalanus amphitrite]|uniref:uncharacterized protein LOC122377189 n=1 Tax=Amphibalanus amphitrite TaxID=1232801 RepID=UPI001C922BAC
GWPDKVKNKFSKLPEDVKTKIFGGNVKGLTQEEISQLNKGQLRMLMPRNNLAGLNQTIQEKVFERFKALNDGQSMRRVLETMNVENKMDLIGKIAEVNAKLGSNERAKERVVMSVVDKLGDPRNWTEAEVDSMKAKGILRHYPPARLTRLNNTALINKITIPSGNEMMRMKPTMQKAWADFILHKKMMAKSVGEWTSADITGDIKSSLGTMPLKTLNMIKNDSLYDAFNSAASADTDIGSPPVKKIEPAQGRLIAVKMMSAFKGKSPTAGPAEVKSFVASRLGKLSKFVQPEELVTLLDSSKQDDATVKDVLKNAFSNKQANREKRCEVFKRTEKGKNLATLTAVEVNNLVNDGTLVCVPLKYVNMWVSDSKLTVTKLTPELLSPGQLRAIARNVSALDGYKKAGGGLDLDKLPPSLISVAQPSDIKAYDW